jgi:hypothetical protein
MAFSDSIGLVFRIKADSSAASRELDKFRKDFKSHTDDIGKGGESAFLKLSQSMGLSSTQAASLATALPAVGVALAGIATAAVGVGTALFGLAKSAASYGDSIGDASDKTGLSVKTLSALRFQADISEQSFDSLQTGILKFSRTIVEANQGNEKAIETLKRFGIDPKKAIQDLDGALGDLIKQILRLPEAQQGAAAMAAFGKAGAELLPFLKDFNGDLPKLIENAKRLGAVLSDEDARAAGEFEKALGQLQAQARLVGVQFANQFLPDITRAMNEVSKFFTENQDTVREWGQAVSRELSSTLNEIKSQGGGWKEAGAILARKLVDGFATIIVLGITGAVNEAVRQGRETLARQWEEFKKDPLNPFYEKTTTYTTETTTDIPDKPKGPAPAPAPDFTANYNAEEDRAKAAKKAADEREKLARENAEGMLAIKKATSEGDKRLFESEQEKLKEYYKASSLSAALFLETYKENEAKFVEAARASFNQQYEIEVAQEKNRNKQQAKRI